GYNDVKEMFLSALRAKTPVHFLMVGPPATAKSLFLEELSRIPGSTFVVAGTTTGPGLRDLLLEQKPHILLIDELDKVRSTQDISVLLTLMERQVLYVTTVRHGRQVVHLPCRVFAATNKTERIPPELLSRFVVLNFKPYTDGELKRVMVKVLTEREYCEAGMARYIAEKLIAEGFRDPRDAVKAARLARAKGGGEVTEEIVNAVIGFMKKYRPGRGFTP
ncbi:MAG: AAA family ATPase, partial [Candidatus Freyarchaeota archaeon]|nr:AAA family ATPase [Candidatus Jordarchaeia archaeon]